LRDHSRPRHPTEMAGKKNVKIKKLRVPNKNAAGNCVIRILTLNDIIICTIIADAKKTANRCRYRRYSMITLSESETLAAVSLFSN
jgi:hypothetical protein